METDYMLTSEVARLAGVSSETVRQWDRKGTLAAMRTDSGVRLFKRVDVETLMRARKASHV